MRNTVSFVAALLAASALTFGCGPADPAAAGASDPDGTSVNAGEDPLATSAVTWHGTSTAALNQTTQRGTQLSLGKPSQAQAGDVALAAVTTCAWATVTPPAGWTALPSTVDTGSAVPCASGLRLSLFWHVVDTADASYAFDLSGHTRASAVLSAYANVDPADPVDALATASASTVSTSLTTPSVTSTRAGERFVALFAVGSPQEPASVTATLPTERADLSSGNTGDWVLQTAAYESDVWSNPGTRAGVRAVFSAATDVAVGTLIALHAAPPPADVLQPASGAWWGIYAQEHGGWLHDLTAREQLVGRTFDIAHTYHGLDQMEAGTVPSADEASLISSGRKLLINLTPRRFSDGSFVTWARVAAGDIDGALVTTAQKLAALAPHKVFIVFHTEPDGAGGNPNGQYGNAADYVAAYRHVRQVLLDHGATNTVWVLNFTGNAANYAKMQAMNPGAANFDWYGYDPYDFRADKGSFLKTVKPTYDWIAANHQADGKPIMLCEYGIGTSTDPDYVAAWYTNIPQALRALPLLKAVTIFDSTDGYDMHIDTTAKGLAAFTAAGHDPFLNH